MESGPEPGDAREASDGVGEGSLEVVTSSDAGLGLSLGRDLVTGRIGAMSKA